MDGRKNNGGTIGNKGGGRKSRTSEKALIEALDKAIDVEDAIEVLKKLMLSKDFRALQLYLSYRWGKPKEKMDITTNEESLNVPMITFVKKN